MTNNSLLEINNLEVAFSVPIKGKIFSKNHTLYAVNKVSFSLNQGETLGIVGESGCGKSTLARAILRLLDHNASIKGKISFLGQDISSFTDKQMKQVRKDIQVVFQDPLASLNPRMTILEIISEPLLVYYPKLTKAEILEKVKNIMTLVGLNHNMLYRYPHEFSGGQNQRVGIARAVILEPKLLVCDEAVSALDVSIKAQIVNLLQDLKKQLNMSVLFISHDLSIVKYISDKIMVLYLGEVMELANADQIYTNPLHPYTKMLIESVPIPDPEVENKKVRTDIVGEIPSPFDLQLGCPFVSRCSIGDDYCKQVKPSIKVVSDSIIACHKVN
ncbi:ABC transporter ATP-binding protein [Rickettsiales bacterium LUAb2]